jgi:DNA-binding CsgD family transcriptional regulator
MGNRHRRVERFEELTSRSQQIARMAVVDGLTQAQISDALGITKNSVGQAMYRAYMALGIYGQQNVMRDKLREHILAADRRACADQRLSAITDTILELYQVCSRISEQIEQTGTNVILQNRLRYALDVARCQLDELKEEQSKAA